MHVLSRLVSRATIAIIAMSIPAIVSAQGNSRLFVTAVRDPGGAQVPSTARSLSLGGVETGSGSADEAIASPSTLMFGAGTDLVWSLGTAGYSIQTPSRTPGVDAFAQSRSDWVDTPF